MKKIAYLILLFLSFNLGFGQTCGFFDDFNRADNAIVGGGWTEAGGNSSIASNELVMATGGVSGRDYVNQDVSAIYNTQLNLLTKTITWSFNIQQSRANPSGFNTNNYGAAFVIGGTNSDFTLGNGYAVVLGQTGTIDNVRLVRYTGGVDLNSNLTDIVTGSSDFGTEHLSIKVTYNPSTDTWELFVRNDGGGFSDPSTLTATDSQGTAIDATYTNVSLDFIGALWNHNTAAADVATFDNIFVGTITTWNGATWDNGTPDLTTIAVIDGNYDTGTIGSFSACNLTISNTSTLTIDDDDYIEVQNDVTVDTGCAITITTQGSFVQNNDGGAFTDNSTNGITLTKSKTMQNWYSYTYWSSPVQNETIENTFGVTPTDRRFRFEAANFIDNDTEIGNSNTFILGTPDDIDDDGNDWISYTTGTMTPGLGYATTASEIVGPGGYPSTESFIFTGTLNNGIITTPLINNSGGSYNDWNLIGNPYACAISVDQFFAVNAGLVDVIYLWDQATPPNSNSGGSQGKNFSVDDYAIINGTGELGARGDTGTVPSRFIPSGQGFFVEALSAGNVTFNNSMRVTGNNTQFFKGYNSKGSKSNNSTANKLWLNLNSDNGISNQILVGYVDGASKFLDVTYYDAPRNLSTNVAAILYSNIENSDKKFAIQGKSPSDLNENEIIDLGFKTAIDVPTLYTLSIAQMQGDFLNDNPVYLKDNLLDKTHDLSVSDYTFTSEVGEFNSRFQIGFSAQALSTDKIDLEESKLKIVPLKHDDVQFSVSSDSEIKSIAIFDMLGRQLYDLKGSSYSETYKLSRLNSSIFIAKVELSDGTIITKKAIKK